MNAEPRSGAPQRSCAAALLVVVSVALVAPLATGCGGNTVAAAGADGAGTQPGDVQEGGGEERASGAEVPDGDRAPAPGEAPAEVAAPGTGPHAAPPAPPAEPPAVPPPQRLPAPPFVETLASGPSPVRRARLARVSLRRNQITDDEAWFRSNGLTLPSLGPARGAAPSEFARHPATYGGHGLIRVVERSDYTVRFYGPNFGGGPLVVVADANGAALAAFDFTDWVTPPTGVVGPYADMWPNYAEVRDGVLYVTHAHRTYATASGGHNAYLSAIDLATGRLLWRTAPLVSNTRSFAIVGDVIVTGYGFTDEKDYLYVIDRATGRQLHQLRLVSGPGYIIERRGRLYVRTYDHDYVFELRVRTAP